MPCRFLSFGVGMGVLAAAGDVFDVGAAGKGASGISHGVSGILQSARRGAVSDAASDMAGLLWQQWMLGENAELSQMRRAMLAAGLTEEEAAFQMGMALASRFGTDAAEGAITAGMSDALGRGVGGAVNAATGHAPQMGAGGDSSGGFSLRPEDGLSSLYDFAPAEGYNPSHYWALPDDVAQAAVPGRAQQQAQSAMQEAPRLTVRMLDADGGEVKTFEIVNGRMPPELAATKPKGSPRVQRWYKEGGTVSLDEDMNWTYTNSDGVRVKYIDGMPDFKTAGCVYDEQDVGRFRSRGSDRRRANKMHGSEADSEKYIWHHTGDGHTMQLVDREIHWQFKHYGGYSRMRRSMVRKTF